MARLTKKLDWSRFSEYIAWKLENIYKTFSDANPHAEQIDLNDKLIEKDVKKLIQTINTQTRLSKNMDEKKILAEVNTKDWKNYRDDIKNYNHSKFSNMFDSDKLYNQVCRAEISHIKDELEFFNWYCRAWKNLKLNHDEIRKAFDYLSEVRTDWVNIEDYDTLATRMYDRHEIQSMISIHAHEKDNRLMRYINHGSYYTEDNTKKYEFYKEIETNSKKATSIEDFLTQGYDEFEHNVQISGQQKNVGKDVVSKDNIEDTRILEEKETEPLHNARFTSVELIPKSPVAPTCIDEEFTDQKRRSAARKQLLPDVHPKGEVKLKADEDDVEIKNLQEVTDNIEAFKKETNIFKHLIQGQGWRTISDTEENIKEKPQIDYFAAASGPYIIIFDKSYNENDNLELYINRNRENVPKDGRAYHLFKEPHELETHLNKNYDKVCGTNVEEMDMSVYRRLRGIASCEQFEHIERTYMNRNFKAQQKYKEYNNLARKSLDSLKRSKEEIAAAKDQHLKNAGNSRVLKFTIAPYPKDESKFVFVGCDMPGDRAVVMDGLKQNTFDSKDSAEEYFWETENRLELRERYFQIEHGLIQKDKCDKQIDDISDNKKGETANIARAQVTTEEFEQ